MQVITNEVIRDTLIRQADLSMKHLVNKQQLDAYYKKRDDERSNLLKRIDAECSQSVTDQLDPSLIKLLRQQVAQVRRP